MFDFEGQIFHIGLLTHDIDAAMADVAQSELGWEGERAEQEVAAYRTWVARYQPRVFATATTASSYAGFTVPGASDVSAGTI